MPFGTEKASLLGAGASSSIKMYGGGGANSGPDPVYNNTEVKIYSDADDAWTLGATLSIGRAGNENNVGGNWIRAESNNVGIFTTAYGFAGTTHPAEPSNYNYDSVNNTSSTIGAAPGPSRSVVGYWSMNDSQYYCCGSRYSPNGNNEWQRYNAMASQAYADDAWTSRTSSPQNCYVRFAAMSFSDATNIAHILGGVNQPVPDNGHNWGTAITNTYEYSKSGDSFAAATAIPSAKQFRYRFWTDNKNAQVTCWQPMDIDIWTRSTDAWTTGTSSSPYKRVGTTMAYNEGLGVGYAAGGETESPDPNTPGRTFTGIKYDTGAGSWSTITSESVGQIRSIGFFGGIDQ